MDKLTHISSLTRANRSIQNKLKGSQLREAKRDKESQNFNNITSTTKTIKVTYLKTDTTFMLFDEQSQRSNDYGNH